uniref:Uncharacterized protein n=1 Tax=Trieres chinensis TaxID=1514140 RepID=A0A7S2EGL5_TRICV|mmetsp:Transcript_23003/g.46688  ORF Transcript_23003/g.46688 Transcript_23003/m.46688 type:complete len:160 (+) Transcript_23003:100-579(+)
MAQEDDCKSGCMQTVDLDSSGIGGCCTVEDGIAKDSPIDRREVLLASKGKPGNILNDWEVLSETPSIDTIVSTFDELEDNRTNNHFESDIPKEVICVKRLRKKPLIGSFLSRGSWSKWRMLSTEAGTNNKMIATSTPSQRRASTKKRIRYRTCENYIKG